MEYDKYHSLVNVVDKNINIAFVHRELPQDIEQLHQIYLLNGD